ncbi:hypothetical protein [Kitasatospora sp. NPDC088779]|uniref:hypothetical protein n=1 Tax=unclassified Kitasatospora TaxID=2633591 RepID=UPI00343B3623
MSATLAASPFPAVSDVADLFNDDPQFARMIRRAELLSHARALPRWLKGNAVDLVLVLLAGQDLGLSTWEAINSFYPDDSQDSGLALYASAQRALLHRAGWDWRIVEATEERCTVAVTDPDKPGQGELFATYTMHDAVVAELTSGPNADFWRRFPKQMLYARVTTLIVNAHAAHVVRGTPRGWGTLLTADPAPLPMVAPGPDSPSSSRIPASTTTTAQPFQDPPPRPDLGNETPIPGPAIPHTPEPDHPAPDDRATTGQHDRPAPEPLAPAPPAEPTTPPQPATGPLQEPSDPTPDHPDTGQPDAPDPRTTAWAVLRRQAAVLRPNGVYQILMGNETRTRKEKESGRLTDDDEQLLHEAQRTLGNSPHAIYRHLRKPDAPSTTEPDHSPPTPLQTASRPPMPNLCNCENTTTNTHRSDCPDTTP